MAQCTKAYEMIGVAGKSDSRAPTTDNSAADRAETGQKGELLAGRAKRAREGFAEEFGILDPFAGRDCERTAGLDGPIRSGLFPSGRFPMRSPTVGEDG
jgi:hypothetical protein